MIDVTRDFTGHLIILIVIEYVFVGNVLIKGSFYVYGDCR